MSELTQVEIATDGACKVNPGPGGWGAVIRSGAREKELSGGEALTTNNRMELTAVIEALNALKRPCAVTLSTDSRYVMDGLTKWIHGWRRNGWKTGWPVLSTALGSVANSTDRSGRSFTEGSRHGSDPFAR